MAVISVTTNYAFPSMVGVNTSVGVNSWTNTQNVTVSDGALAKSGTQVAAVVNTKAHLVLNGVIQTAVNKATNNSVSGTPNLILGGAADLWSATLTPEILNASNFGVAFAYGEAAGSLTKSNYLVVQGFNLNIPIGATIKGIDTSTVQYDQVGRYAAVDYVALRVTYEYEPKAISGGTSGGYLYVADTGQVEPQKYLRYLISDPDGNPIGEWHDVTSDFSIKREMNNALAALSISLGRNELTQIASTAPLLTEDGQTITDESGEALLVDVVAATGLGAGTNLDLNYNIDVMAYYGSYEPLLTEDGLPILDENDKAILVSTPNSAPDGKIIFSGYITDWDDDFGSEESITVACINHGNELNNIMVGRDGGVAINNSVYSNGVVYITDGVITEVAQSFNMVGTKLISAIDIYVHNFTSPVNLQVNLYSGYVDGANTYLTSGIVTAPVSTGMQAHRIVFDEPVTLTNGVDYYFVIQSPILVHAGLSAAFAGGSLYILSSGVWNAYPASDLMFKLYEVFAETKIPFNSYDPSNIAKEEIDYARKQGAQIYYDTDSIEMTGTTVSYTFNLNTIKEALDKVVELCPADWYWTYDPGTNLYSLKSRPTTPTRWFTKKKDITAAKIRKSIARIVNKVFFTGGGDPALLVVENDYDSQIAHRVGISKISDQRVTVTATARILAQSEIARYKEPEWVVTFTVNPNHYEPVENISVGDLAGLSNFGDMIDELELQIVGLTYNVDTVDVSLGSMLPALPKRIEDIKRNLDTVEQQYNPTSPS